MKNKIILSIFASATVSFSAEYIIPPDYDNIVASVESATPVLISNTSPSFSSTTRVIGGRTVRYRCTTIPKISCRGTTPQAILNTSEISLRDATSNQLVNIYANDAFSESSGTNWNVCGAALGGVQYDTSTVSATTDASTKVTTVSHTFIPNDNQETYWFFTNYTGNTGGNNSFMVIETKQICR